MLVYPPNNHETSSETIFFIGSASKSCSINGIKIELYPGGNFCPVFDLELGENVFQIEIDGERVSKVVTRIENVIARSSEAEPVQSESVGTSQFSSALNWIPTSPDYATLGQTPRDDMRICLDPGHGGMQRGTCSPKGIAEKDLNLIFAKKIQKKLLENNYHVVMTREEDKDLALAERVSICKNNKCDLFISVHHNATPDNQNPIEHNGISVHYYYEHSKEIGELFLENLCKETGLKDAGLIWQDLHVPRENPETICVLIEFGYLIHPLESEIITGDSFHEKCVVAINNSLRALSAL